MSFRESGPYPFDSSFSEYKFGHFKKKLQRTDIAFPKSLSLDFARGLIPTRSAILAFENQELILGGNLENNSLTNTAQDDNASKGSGQSAMTGIGSFDLPSVPLGASRPNTRLSALRATRSSFHSTADSHDNKSSTAPPALAAAKTAKSFFGTSMRNFDEPLSSPKLSRAATAKSEFKGIQLSKSLTNSTVLSSPSKKRSTSQEDQELEDWINSPDDNAHKEVSKELNAIDFHRVCALCELRLPRSAVEIKVLRKHIVKLRTAWDPALVSKEVRSLDNTISMYNLVYVCLFCAQFFDPDFPDGIAYPNRVPATVSVSPYFILFLSYTLMLLFYCCLYFDRPPLGARFWIPLAAKKRRQQKAWCLFTTSAIGPTTLR
ncbi:hypothetical protein EON65_10485 [archaeon]|nr:MAG: hypothetical protein EON65_10485 [archaeon]